MIRAFLLVSALILSQNIFGQSSYHPIVLKAKETSYYSNGLNWDSINSTFLNLVGNGTTVEELKPGLQHLLNSLSDKHGSFRSAKNHSMVTYYRGKQEPDIRHSDFVNNVINDISAEFSYQKLGNDVGYLKVVAIGGNFSVKEAADAIRAGVKDLSNQGVEKWIVDLRFNGGGNINPMISGLAPLIGEGIIGGSVDANNNPFREYQIKESQFYDTERLVCEMDNEPKIEPSEKVAVLLSRYTISSGEMLAVAFKGRKNTLFIGEETAGYTTGNGYDQIGEELFMVISQSVYNDRDKNRYDHKVGVDVEMEFQHTIEMSEDKQITSAIEWLKE